MAELRDIWFEMFFSISSKPPEETQEEQTRQLFLNKSKKLTDNTLFECFLFQLKIREDMLR